MKPLEINKVFEVSQNIFILFFGGYAGSKMCFNEVVEQFKPHQFMVALDSTIGVDQSTYISKNNFLNLLAPDPLNKDIANSFCSMICVYAFENLKKDAIYPKIKNEPCVEILRHLRNGSAHGNTFNFYQGKIFRDPGIITWKGKTIDKNLQDKVVFPDFISVGDVPILLYEISEEIKKHNTLKP